MASINTIIEGFTILSRYENGDVAAQHDQIYVQGPAPKSEDAETPLRPEHEERLKKLGFFWTEDSWSIFT